jgi:DNA-binding NarL/FixJ family response regulator
MISVRVILADDHALVRAGFGALLQKIDGVEVVAETGDGREAVRLATTLATDVVFMDIAMKEMNGLEATARIARACPNTHVIILSMHTDPMYVKQALQAGAKGYVLKGAEVSELAAALKAVMRGEVYLTPAVSKDVVGALVNGDRLGADPLGGLTPRQREILQLIAEGNSTKEIAHKLNVSVKTVETHRAQLMDRLDIYDVAGLVRFAVRTGLVSA